MDIPDDIFTEPDSSPDTLANLGPLRRFAGIWEGQRGVDLNPKAEGPERREYYERIEMLPIDAQANGPQLFYGLRYHVHVNTVEEEITFHDQTATGCGNRRPGSFSRRSPFPADRSQSPRAMPRPATGP